MAVQSVKNQYVGINAHLHSILREYDKWYGFHLIFMSDVVRALRTILLPMGYTANISNGLQARYWGAFDTDEIEPPLTEDGSIYWIDGVRSFYRAVMIYDQPYEEGDQPLVWIELLSIIDDWREQDTQSYKQQKLMLLQKGVIFVELNFLYQQTPIWTKIPDKYPFWIAIANPNPSLEKGNAHLYPFGIEDSIPAVSLPLNHITKIDFDLDKPYQKTFEEMIYGLELVDYSQLPVNFESYTPADRLRILKRMITVLEAAKQGQDLEQAPLALVKDEFNLGSAIERYKKLG